ncbi:hypothetical protein [Granulicoccus sp. GXG6511]|uniref:hypothetical protein n=1 Tax=Granulicoccus sp. GXG6511 TaxID=3381351 RepID=UPI003D7CF3A9
MESSRQTLLGAERAAAAPFIDYPRVPIWYPAFIAVIFTLIGVSAALFFEFESWVGWLTLGIALAAVLGFASWYRRQWGTWPRMGAAPPEIRRAYLTCLAGFAIVALLTALAWILLGWPAGLVVVFVTIFVLITLYERVIYPRAAEKVRKRLA